eukprot:10712027-Lingulodinium_polyedra.AAC.1
MLCWVVCGRRASAGGFATLAALVVECVGNHGKRGQNLVILQWLCNLRCKKLLQNGRPVRARACLLVC